MKQFNETKQIYSIRKLTIGAASVLIGLGMFTTHSQVVHASAVNNQSESTQTQSNSMQQLSDNTQSANTTPDQASVKEMQDIDVDRYLNINYQDQNGKTIKPSTETHFEYQGYYKQTSGTITYQDETTHQTLKRESTQGYVGASPNVDSSYANKGYDVDNSQNVFNEDSKQNNFTVHLTHHIDQTQNTQAVNRTINYQDQTGQELHESAKQAVNFKQTVKTDRVTGQKTSLYDTNTKSFSAIDNPVINGYFTQNKQTSAVPVTPNSKNITTNVTYQKLGSYIMLDTLNNNLGMQIYQNDKQDPTKIVNIVPTIDGYYLTKNNPVTNLAKDTILIYEKNNSDFDPSNPNDQPGKPDQPIDHNQPVKPNDPNQPSDSNKTNPVKPVDPNNPNQTDPSNPNKKPDSGKTDPAKPTDPNNPDQPLDPNKKPNSNKNDHDQKQTDLLTFTVNYVDDDNQPLINPTTKKQYSQTKTYKLHQNQQDMNMAGFTNLVIPGYITDDNMTESYVLNKKNPSKTITVKYHKLGQYQFVDQNGKQLHDPITYANSVYANEIGNTDLPDILGYELNDQLTPSTTVLNPVKNTVLTYKTVPMHTITLEYLDADENDTPIGQDVITGKLNQQIDLNSYLQNKIPQLKAQHYTYSDTDAPDSANIVNRDLTYHVYFGHDHDTQINDTAKTTRTIRFIDKATGKPVAPTVVQTAEWTRYQKVDEVNGHVDIDETWQVNTDESKYQHYGQKVYDAFNTPLINGWRADSSRINEGDLPKNPLSPKANQTMTVYYNKNGHFLIHMLKYKQTVVGYDYYTDNDGNTHAVRNPAKDRYILVEDKDHKLNKQTVTYYNDKQQYQSVGGDLAVPGYDDYDDPANAGSGNDPFEEQRKTDGKDIDKIHKLNTGKSLEDLIPKKKKYKLHAEEYQKTLVSDNFTSRKIDVIKGPNGLQVIDGDKFYTGWPYKKHSTDGLNTQTMDLLYAPQNLDVYYRPQYVNNHKVDKNGLVGGGAYGKVTNFDPKKYNPADYADYSEKWAVDNSKKLTKKQIEDDGSYDETEDEISVNAVSLTDAQTKTDNHQPTMFYQILINGKMVKDNLTQDQLDKTKFTINLPDIQGYTKPQNSIMASFSDPLFRTITAVYTTNGQTPNNSDQDKTNEPDVTVIVPNQTSNGQSTDHPQNNQPNTPNNQPDNSSVSTNTPTDGQHNSGKPTDNKPDNNPDHSANNPNKSDNDDSKEPSDDRSNAKPNESDSNDSKQLNNDHSDNNSNKSHNDDSKQPSNNHSNTNPDESHNNDSKQPTDSHNADTNSSGSDNNNSDQQPDNQAISDNTNSSTNDQTSTDKNTDNSASANQNTTSIGQANNSNMNHHNDSTASHMNSSNNTNVNNSNDAAANTSVANKSNSDNQETTLSNKKAGLSTDHTNNQQNATSTHWQTSNKTRQVRQLQNNRSTADQNRSNAHTPNRLIKHKQAIYAKQEASLSVTPIDYTPAKQNTLSPADYQTTNMHMAIASPTLSVNTVGQYLNKANVLPQTGTANNQTNLAIAAIGLAIVVASTSLMIDRRKRN